MLVNGITDPLSPHVTDASGLALLRGHAFVAHALAINPNLVVVDRNQPSMIKLLEKEGLDVIPLKLRHSKLLGGGPHCVTLDVRRNGTLQRYFD